MESLSLKSSFALWFPKKLFFYLVLKQVSLKWQQKRTFGPYNQLSF